MKKFLLTFAIAATLSMVWLLGRVQGQQDQGVSFVSANKAKFEEGAKGVSMASVWGDRNSGAHATFTKLHRAMTLECTPTPMMYRLS